MNLSDEQKIELIKKNIGSYPDFPKTGVLFRGYHTTTNYCSGGYGNNVGVFRDIFSALTSGEVCVAVKDLLVNYVRKNHPDVEVIVGLEARGFLFSLLLAAEIGVACVPIRKKGKLPGECYSYEYVLEYGCDIVQIQKGSIKPGQKVIVIDDLLATGGTLKAAIELLKMAEADVIACMILIELNDLKGREKVDNTNVHSFIQY